MPATLYLGATGSGKTTLMRGQVEAIAMSPDAPLIFVADHGEQEGRPSWADLTGRRIYFSVAEWWVEPSPVAVFRGVAPIEVCRLAIDAGWSLYVDDECDDIVSDGPWKFNPLREIVKRGRHIPNRAGVITAVAALLATHRPANLPTDLIGLFDRVYVGCLFGFNDADRVHREGWVVERTPLDVQRRLAALTPGEFLSWPS